MCGYVLASPLKITTIQSVLPGDKFKKARKKNGIPRQEVMQRTGLSYHQVNQAENNLHQSGLRKMISHYGPLWAIPEAWFYDGLDSPIPKSVPQEVLYPITQTHERPPRYQYGDQALLPLWQSVYAADNGDCYYSEEYVESIAVPALFLDAEIDAFFVARIIGPSLEPMAYTGDRLLVKKNPDPPLHSLVLARSPEGHAVCKVLRPGVTQLRRLCSFNPACPSFDDLAGWTMIGEVRAIFLDSAQPPLANIVWNQSGPIRIPK